MKYKLETKQYEIKVADNNSTSIQSPNTVFEIVKEDFSPVNESMHLLILNVKNKVIDKVLIAKGAYNSLMVTPTDIMRPILMSSGNHFILTHNHPSCDCKPSEEDVIFTNKIKQASKLLGLSFLDHVIYSDKEYQSMKQLGIL